MKYAVCLFFVVTLLLIFACDYDVAPVAEFEYHSHVHSPDAADKHIGDTLHIEVEFESHTGQTVHHVSVRIYNKATSVEIYRKPNDPHVEEISGEYTFEDEFVLSAVNGVTEHTLYVLEAKVWGHEDGVEEVTEQVEFHVLP